jgi:IS30 family transposase
VPKAAKTGRTYSGFLDCIDENGITAWAELDTVIGRIGGKAIMTIHFTFCNFMFGILLDDKTSLSVSDKIVGLKSVLRDNCLVFGDVFPIMLTGNGGEFSDVAKFENNLDSEKEASLYFCDPYKSCQKPKIEKNHTLFRDIAPKGKSFDNFKQDTVNLIFSHVNSVTRKSLNGKTPYEMFVFTYGEKLAEVLGVKFIPAKEVIQSPLLLKK